MSQERCPPGSISGSTGSSRTPWRALGGQPAPSVGVTLRFGEEDLELRLTARCPGPNVWPTDAMRERIALCDGALEDELAEEDGWQLVARMPRGLQGALA